MPNPKHRHSRSRRDKRRANDYAALATLATCPMTGQPHLFHRAYWFEGKMYYKGKVVIDTQA
ncbi:MAG: 50S ribosomal protein L32 [Sphingomonadales bacterium]|nr:50S ribosomal protein L32 [Sphingomonadales bacterium]MBM3935882.1 50S ribosomal protein L32 [Sphingomonadales bacterium]